MARGDDEGTREDTMRRDNEGKRGEMMDGA